MSIDDKMYKAGGDSRTALNMISGATIGLLTTANPVGALAGAFGGYVVDRAFAKSYNQ